MSILQIIGLLVFGFLALGGLFRFVLAVRFEIEQFDLFHIGMILIGITGLLVTFLGIK